MAAQHLCARATAIASPRRATLLGVVDAKFGCGGPSSGRRRAPLPRIFSVLDGLLVEMVPLTPF
jgi:hypothetical protein